MERLTIPDKKIPGGTRRTIIDTRAVREEAMKLYWALKKYEDTGLSPEEVERLKESKRWIPVEERLSLPLVGRYEAGSDGEGAFYLGDCDEGDTCLSENLFVNAWMPLPEPYQGNKEN